MVQELLRPKDLKIATNTRVPHILIVFREMGAPIGWWPGEIPKGNRPGMIGPGEFL